jgi:hypothetical protein
MLPTPQNTPQPMAQDQQKNDRNRQKGTGFTNINKILGANTGAGEKMGQAVGSSLSNQAGQIKQGIEKGKNEFQAGMQTGSQQANQAIQQGKQLGQQVEQNQDQFAQMDPNQLSEQGNAFRNASYTGPQGIQSAGQLQSKAATAGALGRLGASSSGQGQLLASQVAQRGNYGRGQGALDQLLLGKGGQQAIQQGRSALAGVEGNTQNTIQSAQAQAAAKAAGIDAEKTATQQALYNRLSGAGDDTSGGVKGITQLAKEQASKYNEQGSKIQNMLMGKNPDGTTIDANHPSQYSNEDLDLLQNMDQYGLNAQQNIYGKNADEYGNALSGLSSMVDTNQNARYTGSQAGAAQNLASFLGDTATKDKIAGTKFNDAIFNQGHQQDVLKQNEKDRMDDEQIASHAASQAPAMAQYERFLYNAAHPMGSGANAARRSASDAAEAQRWATMMGSNFNPGKSSAAWQQEAAAHTGQQKSLKQLALERMGLPYTPPSQTDVTPSDKKVQK